MQPRYRWEQKRHRPRRQFPWEAFATAMIGLTLAAVWLCVVLFIVKVLGQ